MQNGKPYSNLTSSPNIPVFFCIFTTGFTALGMEILLFYRWSIVSGYMYSHIPLLLSAVFSGLALGSLYPLHHVPFKRHLFHLVTWDLLLTLVVLSTKFIDTMVFTSGVIGIMAVLFIIHFILGIQFRITSFMLLHNHEDEIPVGSGLVYGLDSLGGAISAIVMGFAIPIMGMKFSSSTVLLMKVLSITGLIIGLGIFNRYTLQPLPGILPTPSPVPVKFDRLNIYGGAFLLGMATLFTQSAIVRFTIQSVGESHLSFGVPLGAWLVGICAGSVLFAKLNAWWNPSRFTRGGTLSSPWFLILFPFYYPLFMGGYLLLGLEYIPGIIQLVILGLLLIFPLAFFSGSMFPYIAGKSGKINSIPIIFGLEGLGSLLAGILYYLFTNYWGDCSLPLVTSLTWMLLISFLTFHRVITVIPVFIIVVILGINHLDLDFILGKKARASRNETLLFQANSISGKIEIIQKNNDKILLINHLPMYSTNTDKIHNVSLVHVPAMLIPGCKRILIIGGCTGGAVREAMELSPEKLVYCELDPVFSRITSQYFPYNLPSGSTPWFQAIITDGWNYLESVKGYWDLVILDLPTPVNLQLSRFYTVEGFKKIKSSLDKNGVLSMILPNSYVHPNELIINASIIKTLKTVFEYTQLYIPYREQLVGGEPGLENGSNKIITPYMEIVIAGKSSPSKSMVQPGRYEPFSREYLDSISILGEKYYRKIYPGSLLQQLKLLTIDKPLLPALKWTQDTIKTRPVLVLLPGSEGYSDPMFRSPSETW